MHVVFNVHFLLALSPLKTALLILSSQMNYLSSQFKSTLGPETSFILSHKRSAILGSHVHLCTWSTYNFWGKWRNFDPLGSSNKTSSRSGLTVQWL